MYFLIIFIISCSSQTIKYEEKREVLKTELSFPKVTKIISFENKKEINEEKENKISKIPEIVSYLEKENNQKLNPMIANLDQKMGVTKIIKNPLNYYEIEQKLLKINELNEKSNYKEVLKIIHELEIIFPKSKYIHQMGLKTALKTGNLMLISYYKSFLKTLKEIQ